MAEKVSFGGKPLIPSKYLEAADLNGNHVTVVIESIERNVEIRGTGNKKDHKPVFYLRGKQKGWVLNTTNLNRIAEVHGKKAEEWIGKPVVLYTERVESFGSMVPAVRVDVAATRNLMKRPTSGSRVNGNGNKPSPAPEEPRHNKTTGEVTESSSQDYSGEDFSYGPPAMTDETEKQPTDAEREIAELKAKLAAAESREPGSDG